MPDSKDGKKEEKVSIITAVYKVNLHCEQCAREIKKPLGRVEGVHGVDVDFEKGEIKVKGVIDPIKIHKLIEKLSKKKVELVSPKIKPADKQKEAEAAAAAVAAAKKKKETEEQTLYITSMKVHLHCDQCEKELRKKLLKHKGIFSVKTDMKAQSLTVQGSIKPDKLLTYIKKNVHKHAEIISSKEVKEEKKEEKKEGKKEEKKEGKKEDKKEEKKEEKKEAKKEEKKEEKKGKHDDGEKTQIIEYNEEKKVEVKSQEGNTPYFIHYVYAPQLFSDENPNACCVV